MGLFGLFGKKVTVEDTAFLRGRTDRHTHILFGVDDGIRTLQDSLAVLDYEESLGVTDVWCTPHVMEDVPNTTEALKARFEELKAAYHGSVRLHLAAEYMLDTVFEERLRERDLLTMEDSTLLVETSTWTPPVNLYSVLRDIQSAGYRPLLAHPERYRYLKEKDYEELRRLGIHFQLNLPSLLQFYGETAYNKAMWLWEKGYYSEIGSDCHRLNVIKEQYGGRTLSKEAHKLLKL